MKRIVLIAVCIILSQTMLMGQNKSELQAQKQRAYDEIKLARELMEKTSRQRVESLQQLRILQRGIKSRGALIEALEKEVDMIDEDIRLTQEEVRKMGIENEKNREEYARLVYYAYRNHTDYERLMYILAGESISQSYQRYKYLKYLSAYRKRKAAEIAEYVAQLEKKEEELNTLRQGKLAVLEDKDSEQKQMERQKNERSRRIGKLQQQEKQLKEEIKEKERIARELDARIREIIEAEARKSSADNIYAALTPEQELVGNDFRKNKGLLPWPVERGIITIGYGNYELPGLRGSSIKNSGIDIDSAPGTTVRTVFEGEVTKVFAVLGANYTVLVRHGEYLSVYSNVVNVRVKSGDKVLTKEVLGEAFVDDKDQVARMHFQVWRDRTNLNPEEWISK